MSSLLLALNYFVLIKILPVYMWPLDPILLGSMVREVDNHNGNCSVRSWSEEVGGSCIVFRALFFHQNQNALLGHIELLGRELVLLPQVCSYGSVLYSGIYEEGILLKK